MNNACISGNCLDFDEYNKLKNINNINTKEAHKIYLNPVYYN